jgi:hypothetical protein
VLQRRINHLVEVRAGWATHREEGLQSPMPYFGEVGLNGTCGRPRQSGITCSREQDGNLRARIRLGGTVPSQAGGGVVSDTAQGPGWWKASDGKWYAPELHPNYVPSPPLPPPPAVATPPAPQSAAPPPPEAAERKKPTMKPMKLRGKYLGGLPEEPTPYPNSQGNGNAVFHVHDGGIGVRVWRQGKMHGAISWDRIASIELRGGTTAKSKVGATVMFGVAGALGSAGSQDRTEMTVNLKDGDKAYYQIFGKSELAVRAQLLPVMAQHRISCLDNDTAL